MKVLTVVGARPQFIKAAVVSSAIKAYPRHVLTEHMLHTGQHFDANMSDIFFSELSIPRPYKVLQTQQLQNTNRLSSMVTLISEEVSRLKPDCVLVYGDTDSTLAATIAAVKQFVPVAHVEAGLRSFNMTMPEEINRIMTDRMSSMLFAPNKAAVTNLLSEGFPHPALGLDKQVIIESGDLMYELLEKMDTQILNNVPKIWEKVGKDPFALMTLHRHENKNSDNLNKIFESVLTLSKKIKILFPLHPSLRDKVPSEIFSCKNIEVVEPLSYLETQAALKTCSFVITDSGGLQKEAFFHKKLCFTVRSETEWTDLVEKGFNFVVPIESIKDLAQTVENQLDAQIEHRWTDDRINLIIGEKSPSKSIVNSLENFS